MHLLIRSVRDTLASTMYAVVTLCTAGRPATPCAACRMLWRLGLCESSFLLLEYCVEYLLEHSTDAESSY